MGCRHTEIRVGDRVRTHCSHLTYHEHHPDQEGVVTGISGEGHIVYVDIDPVMPHMRPASQSFEMSMLTRIS